MKGRDGLKDGEMTVIIYHPSPHDDIEYKPIIETDIKKGVYGII